MKCLVDLRLITDITVATSQNTSSCPPDLLYKIKRFIADIKQQIVWFKLWNYVFIVNIFLNFEPIFSVGQECHSTPFVKYLQIWLITCKYTPSHHLEIDVLLY